MGALRLRLHLQLHQHPGPEHHQPHQRGQSGRHLRRPRICHAYLAQARPHGPAWGHRHRHRQRRPAAESAVRRRAYRRHPHPLPGPADLSGHHRHHHRAGPVRQHDRARGEPGRRPGPGQGCRLRGAWGPELCPAHPVPGQDGDPDRRLSAARGQRPPGLQGRARDPGGAEEELPRGPGLRGRPGYHPVRPGVHRRGGQDLLRGRGPGGAGGLRLPAQPAPDHHPDAGGPGLHPRGPGRACWSSASPSTC